MIISRWVMKLIIKWDKIQICIQKNKINWIVLMAGMMMAIVMAVYSDKIKYMI